MKHTSKHIITVLTAICLILAAACFMAADRNFSVICPMGRHSCIYGYNDPIEADQYPPLED